MMTFLKGNIMSKKKAKKNLSTIKGLSRDSNRFMNELGKETDRGAALVAAAFLENVLETVLRAFFIDEQNVSKNKSVVRKVFNKYLESFTSRIDLAYCLGLIGPNAYYDLNLIRNIRNKFAHSYKSINFEDDEVKADCENLKTAKHFFDRVSKHNTGWDYKETTNRDLFAITVTLLTSNLLVRGLGQKHVPQGKDMKIKM